MAVTSIEQARTIAERLLTQSRAEIGEDVRTAEVTEHHTCWVVGYQTVAYLETGAISHALAGGPIIVNRRTGRARFGISGLSPEQQLDSE